MTGSNTIFNDNLTRQVEVISPELERIRDLADDVGRTLSRAFRAAALEGKNLRSLLSDIGRSFANIALKAALKPVGDLVSSLVEGAFTATNPALAGVQAFAKGGVVAAPTYFTMGNGQLSLAGEAGAEAILPLARGADGRMGVVSNKGAATTINFNVTANDARSFVGAEAEISAMLLRAVKRGTRAS